MPPEELTKHDLEKTLEAHAKAIELQILISQQQNNLLEQLQEVKTKAEEILRHFSNGFKSELKQHMHDEVDGLRRDLDRLEKEAVKTNEQTQVLVDRHDTETTTELKSLEERLGSMDKKLEELDKRTWRQHWLYWGLIAMMAGILVKVIVSSFS